MRIIILNLCALLFSVSSLAQDQFFVHDATAATISADASFIDHPDLNGNPGAQIVVSHNWNPSGATGVYNDKNTGVFYSVGQAMWSVYNEDASAMIEDSSYNVYIGDGSDVFLHIADAGAVGSLASYSVLDHPDINGNPNAIIILTTYYNPNSVRNNETYGLWYDDVAGRWNIYSESLNDIPLDSAFFVGIQGTSVASAIHVANAGNISGNWTSITHPLLDGDPDARFVMTHNWGTSGSASNVILDQIIGAWYTGTNWAIYNEDLAAMPEDVEFNLMIYDAALSTPDEFVAGLSYYPNPTNGIVTISSDSKINQVTVTNILGQQVLTAKGLSNSLDLDLSNQQSGIYFAQVDADTGSQTIKLIRK
ncbi:MAG: T9SS type A sorting domain-containing protein [Gilvibacter sp.]